jgi:hypothetical protein
LSQPAQPTSNPEGNANQKLSHPLSLQEDVVYVGFFTTTNRKKQKSTASNQHVTPATTKAQTKKQPEPQTHKPAQRPR